MRWVNGGDIYFLEVHRMDPIHGYVMTDRVMRVAPAVNDMGQRIGWHVIELRDTPDGTWNQLTDAPILMLHEAKTVAETWWRMR
jgi:hypothetical protein